MIIYTHLMHAAFNVVSHNHSLVAICEIGSCTLVYLSTELSVILEWIITIIRYVCNVKLVEKFRIIYYPINLLRSSVTFANEIEQLLESYHCYHFILN